MSIGLNIRIAWSGFLEIPFIFLSYTCKKGVGTIFLFWKPDGFWPKARKCSSVYRAGPCKICTDHTPYLSMLPCRSYPPYPLFVERETHCPLWNSPKVHKMFRTKGDTRKTGRRSSVCQSWKDFPQGKSYPDPSTFLVRCLGGVGIRIRMSNHTFVDNLENWGVSYPSSILQWRNNRRIWMLNHECSRMYWHHRLFARFGKFRRVEGIVRWLQYVPGLCFFLSQRFAYIWIISRNFVQEQ